MPLVVDIVDGLLTAAADASDRQENRRLAKHVKAVQILQDEELSDVQKLAALVEMQYLPHYQHAGRSTVGGSVSATAIARKSLSAGGSVTLGPASIVGQLTTGREEQESSTVTFTIELERRLIGGLVREMLSAGDLLDVPAIDE